MPKIVFLKRYYKVVGQFHSREMCRIMNRYYIYKELNNMETEFPGCLAVMIWRFHCHGLGSIFGQGTEIPQAAQHGQRIKVKKGKGNKYRKLKTNSKNKKKQQQQCTHITQTYKSSTRQMIKQNQINTNKETDTKQRKQKISKERSK